MERKLKQKQLKREKYLAQKIWGEEKKCKS